MEPTEFRRAMEKLAKDYDLPQSVIQPMIFELGIISQKTAEERGSEYSKLYLQVQHDSFKTRLADPRFVAAMKRSAERKCQELDSSEE